MSSYLPQNVKHNVSVYILLHWNLDLSFYKFVIPHYGSNMFFYTCGVNQFWIIVFFAAVKPANNILFCIELIQRPESSLRRHKLGLTDQSIRSNDDKTRFTCVHRLMMTGHSQNICRKVPDDAWQFKFDCSFI